MGPNLTYARTKEVEDVKTPTTQDLGDVPSKELDTVQDMIFEEIEYKFRLAMDAPAYSTAMTTPMTQLFTTAPL